jgi:hypothetical protein
MLAGSACLLLVGGSIKPVGGQDIGGQSGETRQTTYQARVANSDHPVMPVLKWARDEASGMESGISDYSATLISRERSNGKLGDYESVLLKIRHRPFSVYAYVMAPENRKGDEAIYVEGRNDGKLLAHTTGITGRLMRTVALDPRGNLAMEGQRHPITELGMVQLCRRVIQFAEDDVRYAESQVQFFHGVKVGDRPCTCIEVMHPQPRSNFHFHLLRVFVDDQLRTPIRYEHYDWPKQPGGAAELVEEYTYANLKLNNGFGDIDFDPRNRQYAFP